MLATLRVAVLQAHDCSRREIQDHLGLSELEVRMAQLRIERCRDDIPGAPDE